MNNQTPTLFDLLTPTPPPRFDGATFDPLLDQKRLTGQHRRVFDAMESGRWFTLDELQKEILRTTGVHDSITGISARTRDLRKPQWGSHWVHSRRRGDEKRGIWEYSLEVKN